MDTQDDGQTELRPESVDTKHRTIAVIGAWACIGVAVIVVALFFLF
jgi:hypothetical protein